MKSRLFYQSLTTLFSLLIFVTDSFAAESADSCLMNEQCSALFNQARGKSLSGDLTGALKDYQDAYVITSATWLLLNIGRILQRLGRIEESVDHYQRYLLSKPTDAAGEEKARRYLAEAQAEIATPASVDTKPRRSAPAFNTRSLSLLPSDVTLPAGRTIQPAYKSWWFWTLVSVASAGVVSSVGLGVALASSARSVPTLHPFQ